MCGQVVEVFFRNLQTVADKHEMVGKILVTGVAARREENIVAGNEGFGFAIANDGGGGIFFDDPALDELDGLIVAVRGGGFDAVLFQLLDDEGLRAAQTIATGFAAFHFVVGEDFYVVPPGSAVEMKLGCLSGKPRRGEG